MVDRLTRIGRSWAAGAAIAAATLAVLTVALAPTLDEDAILDVALAYLLVALVVSAVWGYALGLATAVVADLLVNFFFIPPLHTLTVDEPPHLVALVLFLAVAAVGASMLALLRGQVTEAMARRQESEVALGLVREIAHAQTDRVALDRLCTWIVRALHCRGCAIVAGGPPWQIHTSAGSVGQFTRDDEAVISASVSSGIPATIGREPGHVAIRMGRRAARLAVIPFVRSVGGKGALVISGAVQLPAGVDGQVLLRNFADEASLALDRARLADEARAAEDLRQADEFKTVLLSSVSHDLRSPLTAIKAAVGSLRDPAIEWDAADEAAMLATIESQTDRLASTVSSLLEMSRIEGGAANPSLEPVEVAPLLAEVTAASAPVAAGRCVSANAPADLWVWADYAFLSQSIANLVENAARYSTPGAPITLSAERAAQQVRIDVADSGPGIPADDLPHVFEKFYRGRQNGAVAGTGLGLAIVKAMIERCNGRVSVASSREGTVFSLILRPAGAPA